MKKIGLAVAFMLTQLFSAELLEVPEIPKIGFGLTQSPLKITGFKDAYLNDAYNVPSGEETYMLLNMSKANNDNKFQLAEGFHLGAYGEYLSFYGDFMANNSVHQYWYTLAANIPIIKSEFFTLELLPNINGGEVELDLGRLDLTGASAYLATKDGTFKEDYHRVKVSTYGLGWGADLMSTLNINKMVKVFFKYSYKEVVFGKPKIYLSKPATQNESVTKPDITTEGSTDKTRVEITDADSLEETTTFSDNSTFDPFENVNISMTGYSMSAGVMINFGGK